MTTPESPPQTDPQNQTNERLARPLLDRLEEGQRHLVDMVRDLREELRSGLRESNRRIDRLTYIILAIGAGAIATLIVESFLN